MTTTISCEIVRPDVLPVVSKVTIMLDVIPNEAIVAPILFIALAIQFGRPPRYIHRVKSPFVISVFSSVKKTFQPVSQKFNTKAKTFISIKVCQIVCESD